MMNKIQIKEYDQCSEMTEKGSEKDCNTCACSLCLGEETELLRLAELGKAREIGIKPNYIENDLNDGSIYVCGSCGCPVSFKEFKATYCYKCGDKADWGE